MLLLSKATANKLYIVCDDILTIDAPFYVWRIYDEERKINNIIELTNEEQTNPRFDLFTLTLPTDLDLETGIYSWYVYESATSGVTDWTTLREISNGTMRVQASFSANSSYSPTETQDYVYNG